MRIVSMLSKAGKKRNEDIIWHNENCAVVLDGSTPLTETPFPADQFVKSFVDIFSVSIEKNKSLYKAANETISILKKQWYNSTSEEWSALPSAAGAFVLITEDSVQLLHVGDCKAVLRGKIGVQKVMSDDIERFDQKVIEKMHSIRDITGANMDDIVEMKEIKRMLLNNRRMMNVKNGYRILSFNMNPFTKRDILEFSKNDIDSIVMFSDGFSIVEEDILRGTFDAETLYVKLRTIENSDPYFNKYPRFKKSDDASIVFLNVE